MNSSVILKPGREKALRNRHHWIFSGAIAKLPDFENGSILEVRSSDNELLGCAYFNLNSSIVGRMLSFGSQSPEDAIRTNIKKALDLRNRMFKRSVTNAFRLINAEGDSLPGLVADLYDDVLVIQVTTLGMEKLKPLIIEILAGELKPRAILEKSELPSRAEEGLKDYSGVLYGENVEKVCILENGWSFWVKFDSAQKTGFYLDQREMRQLAGFFAAGRRILNAFSYTGAFSVYGLKGGAARADSVDISPEAIKTAVENFELNGLSHQDGFFFTADVFEFLREPGLEYDFIILDPPAFAKKKADIVPACRGYKDINRLAIQNIKGSGYVLTCSCSHFIDENLFQKVVFQAAAETGRKVKIIHKHRQAFDHPINIYHPETAYLKGFLLAVD